MAESDRVAQIFGSINLSSYFLERRAKGLSLKQIANSLNVSVRTLTSRLESEHIQVVPLQRGVKSRQRE